MIYALEGGEASLGKWKGEGLEIGSGWLELRHGHGLSQDTEKIKSQVKKKKKTRWAIKVAVYRVHFPRHISTSVRHLQ